MDGLTSSFLRDIPKYQLITRTLPVSTVRLLPAPPLPSSSPHVTTISSIRIRGKPKSLKSHIPSPTSISEPVMAMKSLLASLASKKKESLSLLTLMFKALDDIITDFLDPPIKPSLDPKTVLSGNFAPVDELPPTECQVLEGSLPQCLDGAYIRNGPNPQFVPRGAYHLFDGDGMLHSIRISRGRATFCSRYVKTNKYTVEHNLGSPVFPNIFSGYSGGMASAARTALFFARVLTGQFNPFNGIGQANTSLAFFGNGLYALGESDLPYSMPLTPDGDIETHGRHNFDGMLSMSMTAHPKVDRETGETYAYKYNPFFPPFLTFFKFDRDGVKHPDMPVLSLSSPPFLHDFAITRKYAVFPDTQMEVNPKGVVLGGSIVVLKPRKVPRIGIIRRDVESGSQMRWFDVPGCNIMHIANAWDEEDDGGNDVVVMVAPNTMSAEHFLERMDLVHGLMEKITIDLKDGRVSRRPISAMNLDLPVINPAYIGKYSRYVYAGVADPMPKMSGVVKLDLARREGNGECVVASRNYGPGCYGGEPFFVARDPEYPEAKEDDGYIMSYVHDEKVNESRFLVMDAKSPDLDVVAVVKLPQRVPYGFHGIFVRDGDPDKL